MPKSKARKGNQETETTLTPEELVKLHGTKSGAIRALNVEGFPTAQIARMLNIKYQFARNVLTRPLKRQIKKEREAERANQYKETQNQTNKERPND